MGIGGLAITELSKYPREGPSLVVCFKFKTGTERIELIPIQTFGPSFCIKQQIPARRSTGRLSEKSSSKDTGGHRGNTISDKHGIRGHGSARFGSSGRGGLRSTGLRGRTGRRSGRALRATNVGIGGVKSTAVVLDRCGAVVLCLLLTLIRGDADVECLIADELLEQAS